MAFKDKIKIPKVQFHPSQFAPAKTPSALLYWQLALGGLALVCLLLAGIIWTSGEWETREAFSEGRRLLIRLDNGDIQGKITSTEPAASTSVPEKTTAEKEAEAAAAHARAAVSAPVQAKDEVIALPATLSESDNSAITAATVPLAAIKDTLSEKTPAGVIPAIGSDGARPWQYYAKPFERKGSLPMIAIIITGLGESKSITENADKLPENFSFSFSPYAKDVGNWVRTGRTAGHEAFLDLPLEASNYPASDPGPYGLLLSKGPEDNSSRLQWLMSRAQGYVGFVTPQNEAYSSNPEYFKSLMQTLSEHGLLLIVGHEPAKDETKKMLAAGNTATLTADALIDEDLSPTAIQARLASLEQTAKARGYAIGIASALPITMQQLKAWEAKLPEQGFVLVPVTFIAHLRFS